MFKKLFAKNQTSTEVLEREPMVQTEKEEVIDSKLIQKDISAKLDQLLEEAGVNYTRSTEIGNLRTKLAEFKEDNQKLYDKIKTLSQLGFTNTPTSRVQKEQLEKKEEEVRQKIMEIQKEISYYEKMEKLNAEYAIKYPFFKFVPTVTMVHILKKYNLFLGDTCFYGKEIPMDAIDIAKGFMTEINESKKIMQITQSSYGGYRTKTKEAPKTPPRLSPGSILDWQHQQMLIQEMQSHRGPSESVVKAFEISKLKIVAPMTHFIIPEIIFQEEYGNRESYQVPVVKINNNNYLEICADKLNAAAIEDAKRKVVLDPILMLEVPEGFIILKAWDEEADIIEIQNGNFN